MKKSTKRNLILATVAGALAMTAVLSALDLTDKSVSAPTQAIVSVQTAVLRQGSTGGEVKEVQRRLKLWGYYNGCAKS